MASASDTNHGGTGTTVRPLAIGLDIVDIRRIAAVLERYPQRFTARIFTAAEQAKADRRPQRDGANNSRAATYARRFAAKEACAKALGTGVPRRGVHWRDIEVRNLPSGAPEIHLSGGALARAKSLVAQQGTQGTEGTEGRQGRQGTEGRQGRQGTEGRQGTQSAQGTQGTQSNVIEPELQVSLTDEYPYAQAIVWLLARAVPDSVSDTDSVSNTVPDSLSDTVPDGGSDITPDTKPDTDGQDTGRQDRK